MKLEDIVYLRNVLGEEVTSKLLNADEERISILSWLLKKCSIKNVLPMQKFQELCYKLAYGKYGKVFARVLDNIGTFNEDDIIASIQYRKFIDAYLQNAWNDDHEYINLFEIVKKFDRFTFKYDYESIMKLVHEEVRYANKQSITIGEFIENGGSLDQLINTLSNYEIKEFNTNTKVPKLKK